jgi:RNA polymerase sigma factor (TIGR02999 family)
VHEAWLHLARSGERAYADRSHFVAVAARTIRRVLVNHAVARTTKKRGGKDRGIRLALDEVEDTAADHTSARGLDLLALDEAMTRFEALDPRAARAVELRYFGGLSVDEIATALDVSARTVDSDLAMARAWLLAELGPAVES